MASPSVRTRPVTRNKLAQFLDNQEMIRLVENLTQDVGTTLPANIADSNGSAAAALAAAATVQANLNVHTAKAAGAHAASAISVAAGGGIASTNVQAALQELSAEVVALQAGPGYRRGFLLMGS